MKNRKTRNITTAAMIFLLLLIASLAAAQQSPSTETLTVARLIAEVMEHGQQMKTLQMLSAGDAPG